MFKVFRTGGVVAATLNAGTGADNQRKTAMEADTIQHGRSSKSQKSIFEIFNFNFNSLIFIYLFNFFCILV